MITSIRLLTALMLGLASILAQAQDDAAASDRVETPASQDGAAVSPEFDLDAPPPAEGAEAEATNDAIPVALEPAADFTGSAFTLLVHPIFTPDQADQVYRPLVDFLNARTPYRFELQTARDFHRYWVDIRRGQTPDLVLEDAHLIALRMQRFGYVPLVQASEPASFSLLTTAINADAELGDFISRPVSSMPAPSLGYLVLASWFDNPMQQPLIQSNASSWLDAVEIVFSMEAEAAIVPHNLVARYVNMDNIRTSDSFPHASIAAHPRVPSQVRRDIIAALTSLHEDPDFFVALNELDIEQFVPAQREAFDGLDRWLDEVFTAF